VLHALLLFVLVLRAFVPQGYMPDSEVPGALKFCATAGTASPASLPQGEDDDSARVHDEGFCFFGVTHLMGPPSTFASAALAPVVATKATLPAGTGESLAVSRHAHQPRGPPSIQA
jgi:hypothetical protein